MCGAVPPEYEELLSTHYAELSAAAAFIQSADSVLVCAAAGMSIGCGLNYSSEADFAKNYPALLQYGFTTGYSTMGWDIARE